MEGRNGRTFKSYAEFKAAYFPEKSGISEEDEENEALLSKHYVEIKRTIKRLPNRISVSTKGADIR